VRELKPSRVIEVGAGFSTLMLARALAANGSDADVTLIEPYPNPELLGNLSRDWRLVRSIVQQAPLEIFGGLGAGDVLFYDGSHCLNTGSDVEWIFFHVLPRLRQGVWIHFHDIQWPHGYPEAQVLDDGLSWNEQYVLEAFLAHNNAYRLRFSTSLMLTSRRSLMTSSFRGEPVGASVWIEKTG
jgi:predicted O-methyltransferase YrrM